MNEKKGLPHAFVLKFDSMKKKDCRTQFDSMKKKIAARICSEV
jgi:hypothetical protein